MQWNEELQQGTMATGKHFDETAKQKVEWPALTTDTERKQELVTTVVESMRQLSNHGFSEPIIESTDWATSVAVKLKAVAVEIEIDWRELQIFSLIVKLENGRMPNGYFMSNDLPCRYYLQRVIKDRGWKVDVGLLSKGSSGARHGSRSREHPALRMADQFSSYRKVIESCVGQIVREEKEIFTARGFESPSTSQ